MEGADIIMDKNITKQALNKFKEISAKLDLVGLSLTLMQEEINDSIYALNTYLNHLDALPKRNEKGEYE